jgi:hypothetical protein
VDQAVEHFTNDLTCAFRWAMLSQMAQVMPEQVPKPPTSRNVHRRGPRDHVAFRGDIPLSVGRAQGDKPLPVVITYTREDGRPQFWAQFSRWNLTPEAASSMFVFKPPAGAAKITFAPKLMLQPGGEAKKEGK